MPTAEAAVGETMAGITRHAAETGDTPARKLAATAAILRQILAPIESDLAGRRDRALLLLGFAGALRRAELAAVRVEHLEPCDRGLRLVLPLSKGGNSAATRATPCWTFISNSATHSRRTRSTACCKPSRRSPEAVQPRHREDSPIHLMFLLDTNVISELRKIRTEQRTGRPHRGSGACKGQRASNVNMCSRAYVHT
jgi:hypothetical protein